MPDVLLELRMPSVVVVAGTMVAPWFVVRNSSSQEVSLSNGVTIVRDPPDAVRTPEPREFFAVPRTGPIGAYETRIPPGQTREAMSTAQVPFDASHPVRLRAGASLGVLPPNALFSSRVTSVQVEIPLQVTAATSADELKLELKADQQQWCLHAMDSHGARPTGPLFLALTVRGARGTAMTGDLPSATGDAWAMRWTQLGSPSMLESGSATLTAWVGGPRYVTARSEATVTAGP
jgi:hypothetical protein